MQSLCCFFFVALFHLVSLGNCNEVGHLLETPSPTKYPTVSPTFDPTKIPSKIPTAHPTVPPTYEPTKIPSKDPTFIPSVDPTMIPTRLPTSNPTHVPSDHPTEIPTFLPTRKPTSSPTRKPTYVPTHQTTYVPLCISFVLADKFGDGFGSANFILYDSYGQSETVTPTCDSNPIVAQYCFDPLTARDGDTVSGTVFGFKPRFAWEILWQAIDNQDGRIYTGTYETTMSFMFNRVRGVPMIKLSHGENLLPNYIDLCQSCLKGDNVKNTDVDPDDFGVDWDCPTGSGGQALPGVVSPPDVLHFFVPGPHVPVTGPGGNGISGGWNNNGGPSGSWNNNGNDGSSSGWNNNGGSSAFEQQWWLFRWREL